VAGLKYQQGIRDPGSLTPLQRKKMMERLDEILEHEGDFSNLTWMSEEWCREMQALGLRGLVRMYENTVRRLEGALKRVGCQWPDYCGDYYMGRCERCEILLPVEDLNEE
jgi:hypothetical protein